MSMGQAIRARLVVLELQTPQFYFAPGDTNVFTGPISSNMNTILVCGEGPYIEGNAQSGTEKRAAIFIGPEFGTVTRPDPEMGSSPSESTI
jgi:hypothetical protein